MLRYAIKYGNLEIDYRRPIRLLKNTRVVPKVLPPIFFKIEK